MKPRALARLAAAAGTATVALAITAGPASAHVGTSEDSVAAGSSLALGLTVGHGCEESPTREVVVQIPAGVINATPFAHPGWSIAKEMETLSEPVTNAWGEEVTERVSVITFTANAGNELPDGIRDTFSVNFTAPDAPGETLYFKTIQSCVAGETAWIEEWDGQGEEPEHPAPSVEVTEAEPEDGQEAGAATTTTATDGEAGGDGAVDETAEPGANAPTETEGESGSGNGLAVAGIVLGGLGVATGGAALAKTRKVC